MSDDNRSFDSFTVSPSSRIEMMELAIRTALVAHLIVAILALIGLAAYMGEAGLWFGLAIAAVFATGIPFLVLPVAAAIGFFTHLAFHRTQLPIPTLVRVLTILFEASLLVWIILIVMLVR
jgi:hypothetical protein